ncbi:MAG: M14 metallopeptidase family protein [Bacillota bacterium]
MLVGQRTSRWLTVLVILAFLCTMIPSGAVFAKEQEKELNIPSPVSYLGFTPGEDKKLADWEQIKEYYAMVDKASSRVVVEELGPTAMGDKMIMAIVSSSDTIARLDHYKEIQRKLADPRGVSEEELAKLKAEAKTVVMVGASIHSTEIGGTQAAINVLYRLASSNEAAVKEMLDNTILLLVPSLNPDGHKMVVDWYRQYLGTKFEGSAPPWLYNKYVGHDDNRDWFMFNLDESKAMVKPLYQDWFPEIVYDIHQMGSNGARLFVPPFFDPPNPEIDPLIFREIMLLGGAATTDLASKGQTGISTDAQYDTWWHGGFRSGPYYHNMVGLLTEAASVSIATPVEVPFEKLTGSTRGLPNAQTMLTNFPDIWPGGTWRLADIVAYEETVIYSYLTAAARYRETFVGNFVKMGQNAVTKGQTEGPAAFVIPAEQKDPATVSKMIETLLIQGVEVQQAQQPFTLGEKIYPAGSYVVSTTQPYRANVMALLEKQTYPERREFPGGPAERPYDIAGWTLPMQMGVECIRVEKPFEAKLTKITAAAPVAGIVAEGNAAYGYAFGPEANNAAVVRSRLLAQGFMLLWAEQGFKIGDRTMAPGTTIVLAHAKLPQSVAKLAQELSVSFYPLATDPKVNTLTLRQPRVALYENWGGNSDTGWTRVIFDQYGLPYNHVHDADLKTGNLNEKYDIIVLPDSSLNSLKNGLKASSYPDEYTGGLGDAGLANLKNFVENGGTVLALDSATEFATKYLGVTATNITEKLESKDFYCPGSILEIDVANTHPVAYGLSPKTGAYFVSSPTFEVGAGVTSIASYPADKDPLMSGWLMGSKYIQGKTALAEAPVGKGRVIMVGFRAQHRGQPYGTYKVLFNSIFYAAAQR